MKHLFILGLGIFFISDPVLSHDHEIKVEAEGKQASSSEKKVGSPIKKSGAKRAPASSEDSNLPIFYGDTFVGDDHKKCCIEHCGKPEVIKEFRIRGEHGGVNACLVNCGKEFFCLPAR